MQNLNQKILNLDYLQKCPDFFIPRESALMCIHSMLTNQEHIPRVYFANQNMNDDRLWSAANYCLLSDHRAILEWTNAHLKLLNFSKKDCRHLNREQQAEYIRFIEEELRKIMGEGFIHYEAMRFTPFCQDIFYDALSKADISHDKDKRAIVACLKQRVESCSNVNRKHANTIYNLNLHGEWDSFHTAFKFKLEQAWQKLWLDCSKYRNESNIIHTILTGDSFDF